jgi:hypothetical protein
MLSLSVGNLFAAENNISYLNKDVNYDITIEINQTLASNIKNVRVIGVADINGKYFLIIQQQEFIKPANALVSLDSVKLILPSGSKGESVK